MISKMWFENQNQNVKGFNLIYINPMFVQEIENDRSSLFDEVKLD